jgi:hypothetical protein
MRKGYRILRGFSTSTLGKRLNRKGAVDSSSSALRRRVADHLQHRHRYNECRIASRYWALLAVSVNVVLSGDRIVVQDTRTPEGRKKGAP